MAIDWVATAAIMFYIGVALIMFGGMILGSFIFAASGGDETLGLMAVICVVIGIIFFVISGVMTLINMSAGTV